MFQRIGAAAYRSDLINITALCNIIGNPQQHIKCIHIAGTNGKGSVTHIIASILQEQGYKVGVFTSPHYKDYRERVKINGRLISKSFVTNFVEKYRNEFQQINASFFEITTAMAFDYFNSKKVDFAVIETGMGGRLDSTNIINPIVSAITNISYDHMQFLGNTLEKIAFEKAGIIKPNTPIVIGETQKETKPVFVSAARQKKCIIQFADKIIKQKKFITDLKGNYQKKNIVTALATIDTLRKECGVSVRANAISKGLRNVCKNTRFIGRWMEISKKPLVVFDSAHNEGGLKELKNELRKHKWNAIHFVYGTVGDKDIAGNLALLPQKATYYFCKANLPRGLDAKQLQHKAQEYGLKGNVYGSVKHAYNEALKNAGKNDLVLVAGSVFVVAEVM